MHAPAEKHALLQRNAEAQSLWRRLRRLLASLMPGAASWRDAFTTSHTQKLVAHVADALSTEMGIWQIEDSTQSKACIASWARRHFYRGYVLCSDVTGHTCLLDLRRGRYLSATSAHLLQIDGLEQAQCFLDVFSYWQDR